MLWCKDALWADEDLSLCAQSFFGGSVAFVAAAATSMARLGVLRRGPSSQHKEMGYGLLDHMSELHPATQRTRLCHEVALFVLVLLQGASHRLQARQHGSTAA